LAEDISEYFRKSIFVLLSRFLQRKLILCQILKNDPFDRRKNKILKKGRSCSLKSPEYFTASKEVQTYPSDK
jgi:hypothetical protein